MAEAFLLPLILHIVWVGLLYGWLTLARFRAVWARGATESDAERADELQPQAGYVAANLANQFELPPLAWFCALALIHFEAVGALDITAASRRCLGLERRSCRRSSISLHLGKLRDFKLQGAGRGSGSASQF